MGYFQSGSVILMKFKFCFYINCFSSYVYFGIFFFFDGCQNNYLVELGIVKFKNFILCLGVRFIKKLLLIGNRIFGYFYKQNNIFYFIILEI